MATKTFAAVMGGAAVVALGIAGMLSGSGGQGAPAVESASQMTLGATQTVAYSATAETTVAVPTDKAKPFGGSGG